LNNENKLRWCLNKAKKELQLGKTHRGLVIISSNPLKAKAHIDKAISNLDVADLLLENNHPDWSVIAIFYASYHSLLAVLANFGYESRNQECTFSAVLNLINENKLNIDAAKIERIKHTSEGIGQEPDLISLREFSQYEVGTSIQMIKVKYLKKEASELITEIREELGI